MGKKNYDIAVNKKLQSVVDAVYLSDEDTLMGDNKDGLNFNMPEDDDLDINLDLDSEISLDDIDLDINLDDEISLSGSDDILDNDLIGEDDIDLELSDADEISLSEEDDEIENNLIGDDDLDISEDDLELSDTDEISLSEEDDEIENNLVEEDDIDLFAEGETTGQTTIQTKKPEAVDEFESDDDDESDFVSLGTGTFNKTLSELLNAENVDETLQDVVVEEDEAFIEERNKKDVQDIADALLAQRDEEEQAINAKEENVSSGGVSENVTSDEVIAVDEFSYNSGPKVIVNETTGSFSEDDLDVSTAEVTAKTIKQEITDMDTKSIVDEVNEQTTLSSGDETSEFTLPMDMSTLESVTKGTLLTSLSSNELLDLRVTLAELREDRTNLLDQITDLEEGNYNSKQENLTLKADMDELKIEISILKKRHLAELEDLRHNLSLAQEKKEVLEAKNKSFQKEIDRLGQRLRVDFGKIKQREKDLESQLELVSMDTDSKVKSRDTKILELKRKIDSLEFNMENVSIKERQSRTDKVLLEDKLNKVVGTLRHSLKHLEEEMDVEVMKKDLDI